MIKVVVLAELYDRCSSIEIKVINSNMINVRSLDNFLMSTSNFTNADEIRFATITAVLKLYLRDEVIIDENLCKIFENEMQLQKSLNDYNSMFIMYSDIIVKSLIKTGYKDGLNEKALSFFSK